uniref:Uncharacterized protein n=1 Tax=uncultured marine virus TaxID=186617 RepID=A0A0F7L772_9VIRU|nr:hypothetical protein [uncultured marine virus]
MRGLGVGLGANLDLRRDRRLTASPFFVCGSYWGCLSLHRFSLPLTLRHTRACRSCATRSTQQGKDLPTACLKGGHSLNSSRQIALRQDLR